MYQSSTVHGVVGIPQDSHDLESWNSKSLSNIDYYLHSDVTRCSIEGSAETLLLDYEARIRDDVELVVREAY